MKVSMIGQEKGWPFITGVTLYGCYLPVKEDRFGRMLAVIVVDDKPPVVTVPVDVMKLKQT